MNNRVKFNDRDSHDVITYNSANYVGKSMVDKTEHVSVYIIFYTVNKIIIYPTRLEADMLAALNFLHQVIWIS